jgi:hypothetical protein
MKQYKIVSIKYAFRDEKQNVFMMTEGNYHYQSCSHLFVCKNTEVPKSIKQEYLLLDSKRGTSYALSNFGKEITNSYPSQEKQFIATIESVLVFKITKGIINKLVTEFFPVWEASSPLQYFGANKIGYLWLFRTYESLEKIPENLMDIGRSGRNYYYLLRDSKRNSIELNTKISDPTMPESQYSKRKRDLIDLLVSDNVFVREIPGVDCISIAVHQTRSEDENEYLERVNEAVKGKEAKFKHNRRPKAKQNPIIQNGNKCYPRDRKISLNALAYADYLCEVNPNHKVFLRKMSNIPYTEPHHLVPISYSDDFDVSLDIEENIVSLCSHCHNLLHYGQDANGVLKHLYQQRREGLSACGIDITWDQLVEMYR